MYLKSILSFLLIFILKFNSTFALTQDISLIILVRSPLDMEYVLAKSICKLLDRELRRSHNYGGSNTLECNIRFDESIDEIITKIEHIEQKEIALKNIYDLLKPNGKLFVSFPPKYCAYAGHQQTIPAMIGKLPYLHLLPNFLYKGYLGLIGCPDNKTDYLLSTKETRISIYRMRKLLKIIGFNIIKESNWFLRPAYSFRFGLPRLKNIFSVVPILDEIFTNGVLYVLERPEA